MRINVKPGVVFKEINEHYLCIIEALHLMPFTSYVPTITSANDGKHMATSLHYKNRALDIRINDLPSSYHERYRALIAERCGPEYQVILEKDHIHCEYDPKPKEHR